MHLRGETLARPQMCGCSRPGPGWPASDAGGGLRHVLGLVHGLDLISRDTSLSFSRVPFLVVLKGNQKDSHHFEGSPLKE